MLQNTDPNQAYTNTDQTSYYNNTYSLNPPNLMYGNYNAAQLNSLNTTDASAANVNSTTNVPLNAQVGETNVNNTNANNSSYNNNSNTWEGSAGIQG